MHPRSLISVFVIRYLDGIMLIAGTRERLLLASVAEQAGLSLTFTQTFVVEFYRDVAQCKPVYCHC